MVDNTKDREFSPEIKQEDKQEMAKIKNIYHRADGRWEYRAMRHGNKAYLIASTKEKLIKKIKEYKEENRTAKIVQTYETVESWTKKWLDLYKTDLTVGSRKRYLGIINNHIIPFFKNVRLDKVTQEKVQQFINNLPTERNREYGYITIRQILKQAYINKKIKENIAEQIVKPRRKTKSNKTALSLLQQELFLQKLKEYEPDIQMFMYFSLILGSRRGETDKFKFEDINKDKNSIHIKGTKTYGADRRIKISNAMIELLEKNKTQKDDEFYFLRKGDFYSRIACEIFTKCNIKGKTMHDLRHTCSTNLYYLGVMDKQRQQILGHSTIVMTNDVYTNLQEDIDKEGLLKLYNNLYYEY